MIRIRDAGSVRFVLDGNAEVTVLYVMRVQVDEGMVSIQGGCYVSVVLRSERGKCQTLTCST